MGLHVGQRGGPLCPRTHPRLRAWVGAWVHVCLRVCVLAWVGGCMCVCVCGWVGGWMGVGLFVGGWVWAQNGKKSQFPAATCIFGKICPWTKSKSMKFRFRLAEVPRVLKRLARVMAILDAGPATVGVGVGV